MTDTPDPDDLSAADRAALLRWRLAIGPGAEQALPAAALDQLAAGADGLGVDPDELGELDEVLAFVYDGARAGKAAARPYLPRWLGGLRKFFRKDVVAMVQQDAIDRRGLAELMFEPETLPFLDRNVELVATIMAARHLVPDQARDLARQIVREVVDDLRRQLEPEIRTAVLGAVRRDQHAPLPSLRNLDWPRTIRKNLGRWDADRKRLLADRLYFWKNQRRRQEWDVVLAVDQSGSMAQSVVYAAVMAAIFASLDVLRTRLCFFDTEVVDATPLLTDPVDVLFSTQLGGGTDINRAVAWAREHLVERPERTLFVLVSDLYEGGDAGQLVARMRELVESRARVLCVLALTDDGRPSYDHGLARELTAVGVACFGCTPRLLTDVVARVLRGQDPAPLLAAARAPHVTR
ncbi:MAG: VWA domain-containing protein [Kofleriaceae bacterium]|nr:VWA domain-containing protein [Kofleriaceae bacterium]MCB9575127.1 VWA domain-containing protein [Kofleriaceae bacterium]